jgi:hypothetical protein
MAKPKPKKETIKKVVVTTGISHMDPAEKIAFARGVNTTCKSSATFKATQPCQDSMTAWMGKTDALESNQTSKKAALAQLALLTKQEATCIFEYDEAANAFASVVQTTAKGDSKIVTEMGMSTRADAVRTTEIQIPTGLRITVLKSGQPKLEWDPVQGAALYTAQMSPVPATEATFTVLYGKGRSRALPPLALGQNYVLRVCAIASDGKPTAWSETVSYVAK